MKKPELEMNRCEIEAAIREVLQTETKAIPLSNKLFRPDGLFAKLASTQAERQELTKTPLFQEAQRRLSELQRTEMAELRKAVSKVEGELHKGLITYRSEELTAR
jgi:hypothetical protein